MKDSEKNNLMKKIVSLCKQRGFIFPGSEIYGGLANSWDFGPLGVELKNNIKQLWWRFFVRQREDMYGIDTAIIMNRKVWQASGHEAGFIDPLIECAKCHQRFRADKLYEESHQDGEWLKEIESMENLQPADKLDKIREIIPKCPSCGANKSFTVPKYFNLMFKTYVGAIESEEGGTYLRPETAQGMFVNFKQVAQALSPKLPFGLAQIGKAFRNEITPGNFIFRTREFEQMEIEYFFHPRDSWEKHFDYWLSEMKKWMRLIGLAERKIVYTEVPEKKLAHYSKRTVDIDFAFPFKTDELYGIAYRTDFDLKNHQEKSGEDLSYFIAETKEKILPHVIEPTFGVERTVLAVLSSSFREGEVNGEVRTYLSLPFALAPYKAAVFPLLANKPELIEKARAVFLELKKDFMVSWDDRGNIGKRYRAQDEIGTLFCFTIDFQTLEDDTVTVRHRDTMRQERISIEDLNSFLKEEEEKSLSPSFSHDS